MGALIIFVCPPPLSPFLLLLLPPPPSPLSLPSQASLNAGLDLKNAVSLPDDEEMNDWIAVHGKS